MTKTAVTDDYFQQSELKNRSFRFGGREATSPKIVWPLLVLLSLNFGSTGIVESSDTRIIIWRVSFAALMCAGVYFTVLGWVINRVAGQLGSLRTWCIGFLYATTELLRAVLIQVFAEGLGLNTNPQWEFRIVAALTSGLVIFALVSTVVNDSASYRNAYKNLYTQRVQLQSIVESSTENLIRARDQIVDTTREQLEKALRSILTETEKTSPEYPKIIQNLYSVAEETVRPLSHLLFENPLKLSPVTSTSKPPRISLMTVIRRSSLVAPFRPGLYFAMAAILSFPWLLVNFDLGYTGLWLMSVGLIYGTVELARRYLSPHLATMNLIIRCVVITAVYAAPALFLAQVALKQTTNQTGFTLETIFYGLVLGAVLGWLMASSAGMRTARLEMLDEIKQINQELTWQNARIQSELWLDQKSLALTLHNDVQATLLAAALKLKAALDRGEKTANDSLPEIRELISRSINFGEYHSRNKTLDAVIERINNNWAGLITMDVAVSPETLRAIENDFVGLGVLEDVLSEFQNNSLKHGAATKTTAQLTMPNTGILHVVLANNGRPLSTKNSSGLGSAFINSVALKYSLETVQGGVQLILQLPLEGK